MILMCATEQKGKRVKYTLAVLMAAFALGGCNSDSSTDSEEKAPATAGEVGTKDVFNGGYKADCLDCAEDGPNAFVQLGLGDRFWKTGDAWQVVYVVRSDNRTQMQPMQLEQKAIEDVGLVVLDFEVIGIGAHSTAGVERATAKIKITQGEARGNAGAAIEGGTIKVDQITARIDLELDDLLRPVSVTEYSGPEGQFPNGQTTQLDPREALRNMDSAFPYVVPNAYLDASKTALPELPEQLKPVADASQADHKDAQYFFFDLEGKGLESAERVYWRAGDAWPYLVETPYATGILVNQVRQ